MRPSIAGEMRGVVITIDEAFDVSRRRSQSAIGGLEVDLALDPVRPDREEIERAVELIDGESVSHDESRSARTIPSLPRRHARPAALLSYSHFAPNEPPKRPIP